MRRFFLYLAFLVGVVLSSTLLLSAVPRAESFDLPLEPDYGRGVSAYLRGDYEAAAHEFLPLAEENNDRAQYYLGTMYHKGQGVPRDDLQAYIWATLATANGKGISRKRAADLRGKLLKKLTSKQKEKAKKMLREWEKTHDGK